MVDRLVAFSYKQIRPVRRCLFGLKKAFDLVDQSILLSKLSVSVFKQFELIAFFSVHALKIEYNVSLSVAPTRLKELLNMVYHKGQSWDLYSFASILMIYLCIYHHILQNVIICSRMTLHFIQQEETLCNFKRRYSFVLIVFQCGATLITCSLIL